MLRTSIVVAVLLLALATCATAQFLYTGSLSSATGGLVATTGWSPVTLAWTVSYDPNVSPLVCYEYVLNVSNGKNISHMLIEASQATDTLPAFTEADISTTNWKSVPPNADDIIVQNWTDQQGNPNLPGPLYGIKFNTPSPLPTGSTGTSWTVDFCTPRLPVWGDFYAKDGQVNQVDQTAWNAGFLAADPTDPASSGSINNHILVPDTAVVPEIPAAVLAPLGVALIGTLRRKLSR